MKKEIMKGLTVLTVFILLGISGMMAASVDPTLYDPWQSGDASFECDQAGGCGAYVWKIDTKEVNGVWNTDSDQFDNIAVSPPNNATITITNSDGSSFDWESDQPVCTVIVVAGNKAHVYSYPDGAYQDTGLITPTNPNSGKPYDISHVTFCWNVINEYEWVDWGTMSIAYEDLPKEQGNDWDYNDVVIDITTLGYTYNGDLIAINFTFIPETRTAAYVHTFNFSLFADVFGADGTYFFKRSGEPMMTGDYDHDTMFDITIIQDTSSFPAMVTLNISFENPFPFTYPVWDPDEFHGDGGNLFFNPYIDVWNTGEIIDIADVRLLTVPIDWDWPMPDGNSIWNVYTDVEDGDPPGFIAYWWII